MIRAIIASVLFLATSALAQQPAPVKLAWTHSTDNVAVTGYNIYRDGKKIGTSPSTSYTDATVAPTTQYSYTVSAFDAAGNESDTSVPYIIKTGTIIILPPGGDHTFTPLHLYFMAPSGSGGNDGCNGTSPSSGSSGNCAWATPNHAGIVCGDVILAKAGTYANGVFGANYGTVGTCPSTTGGIDGSGGVYFATILCAGASVGDCTVSSTSGNGAFVVNKNNWAIEGFSATTPGTSGEGWAFIADGRLGGPASPVVHHVAFINTIAFNSGMGYATADGGTNNGTSSRQWGGSVGDRRQHLSELQSMDAMHWFH